MSLYISRSEIEADDLRDVVRRSYAGFRREEVTPLVELKREGEREVYLLELFHGPTFAFVSCPFFPFFGGVLIFWDLLWACA